MTEPVFIKRGFLIALMVVVKTIAPPLIAAASLFIVARMWHISFEPTALTIILTLLFVILIRPPRDLSSQLTVRPVSASLSAILQWALLLLVLFIIGYASDATARYPRSAVQAWVLITPLALVIGALVVRQAMRHVLLSAVETRKVIFAGYNSSSLALARSLDNQPAMRLQVKGFFDDRGSDRLNMEANTQLVGRLSELSGFAKANGIDMIFIALPLRHIKRVLDLLNDLHDTTASIYYVPDIFVFDLIQARSSQLNGIPVVALCETPFFGYRGVTKRLIDIGISICCLIVAAPLLLLISLLVKLSSPGPAIFRQRRYGLDGHEIIVYKFRTMTVTEDGAEVRQASQADSRITPIGGFLRRYSLDELPQFINVLQGQMSLVGPRPHAVAHNEQYRKLIKGYMVRHKVRPGITGLAQINGARGETSKLEDMEARVMHDLEYLRRWSLLLDLKILLLTFVKIFGDEKAY
jgi:putative colanic acid biosynthesis UDP-glucose lipid carrier transferase